MVCRQRGGMQGRARREQDSGADRELWGACCERERHDFKGAERSELGVEDKRGWLTLYRSSLGM